GKMVFLAVLFVLIGCCIDIGKYLFWAQRKRSHYYGFLSLVLMGFSWLASCAFLVSSEYNLLRESQIQSAPYVALQQKIDGIKQEVAFHERLLEKRLSSSYHSQWKQGEVTIEKLADLKAKLTELTESSSGIGLDVAVQHVPTTKFFNEISQILNVSSKVTRAVGYGLLSMLLEVGTLGMISLLHAFKLDSAVKYPLDPSGGELGVGDGENNDVETQQMKARLIYDILKGNTPPVLRRIKAADYGLGIDVIRQILKGLYTVGVLETDKRNSYKLAGSLRNELMEPSGYE
ncbi:hypothetical protein, partial [Agarivorans sp.]|uniref:hypothetical protein n=1 Tax=Agarivorans sp. TaxID=1872412 RepID=UPI003D042DC7